MNENKETECSIVERVARALCRYAWERDFKGRNLDAFVEIHWRDHAAGARRAVEAMREPTYKMMMIDAPDMPAGGSVVDIWQDMIDAALKEHSVSKVA